MRFIVCHHQIFANWDGAAHVIAGDVQHGKVSAYSKTGKPNKGTVQLPAVPIPHSALEQQHQQAVEVFV